MNAQISRLKRERDSLYTEREFALMSDGFALSNGSLRGIDAQIRRISLLISEAEDAMKAA